MDFLQKFDLISIDKKHKNTKHKTKSKITQLKKSIKKKNVPPLPEAPRPSPVTKIVPEDV